MRSFLDILSGGITVATLLQWLPPIAALCSCIWIGWQVYDRIKYGPKR